MSQRYGMADGRCITEFSSNRIYNDALMAKRGVSFQDNYKYRAMLQVEGPEGLNLPMKNGACRNGKVEVLVENE